MIHHITKDNVLEFWPKISPGLERALDGTFFGETWNMDSLLSCFLGGHVLGFYQEQSGYSGVYCICDLPLSRQLYFFWSGKDKDIHQRADYDELDRYLLEMSQDLKCDTLRLEGRPGWKKILEPLGFTTTSYIFQKAV